MEGIKPTQEKEPGTIIEIIKKRESIQIIVQVNGQNVYDSWSTHAGTLEFFKKSIPDIVKVLKDKGITNYEIKAEAWINPKFVKDDNESWLRDNLETELKKAGSVD